MERKYDNRNKKEKEELSFSDSWKQKNVEMAVLGAIIIGAGRFGVKGDFSDVTKYSKDSFKYMEKGFDRYLNKKLTPVGALAKDTLKKVVKQLKNEKIDKHENFKDFGERVKASYANLDKEKITEEVESRLDSQIKRSFARHNMNNPGQPFEFKPNMNKIIEEVKAEHLEKDLGINTSPFKKDKKKPSLFVNWKENAVGSAITGLGFGAGITAIHGADQLIRGKDNKKQREDSFNYAGSFLNNKDDKKMKKHAGTRELHDGIIDLSKRTPQAIATSLGFTGVSLATGQAMKNKNQKQEATDGSPPPNGSRIIIELGNDDPATRASGSHAFAGSPFGGMPHIANQENRKMEKLSGLLSFDKTKQFTKNIGGRTNETRALEQRIGEQTVNYRDEAVDALKGPAFKEEVQRRYGHLANPNSQSDFFERELLDSKAKSLKRKDEQQLDQIKNEVAKDRVIGLGGLIGLGGTGIAVNSMSNRKENAQ